MKWVDACKPYDDNSHNKAVIVAITDVIKATVVQASRYAQQNLILKNINAKHEQFI